MSGNLTIAPWASSHVFAILVTAAAISFALLLLLRPMLQRYALAHPNARSSHKTPTPQGGGSGVIVATIASAGGASLLLGASDSSLWLVLVATAFIAAVGGIDDVSPIQVLPRLLLQGAAVAVVVAALPSDLRVVPALPIWIERAALGLAILWFVNLTNFMDGIDWMTVAEAAPVAAGLAAFGLAGALPHDATLVAIALLGALAGFAPFNRPVARLFLGDVGSLPIGLLLGWLLVLLAGGGHLVAALLLPLYYLADASITLLRRAVNGEPVTQAHRGHFYQRAVDGDFSVYRVVGWVFMLNIALGGLASMTLLLASPLLHAAVLLVGCGLVALVLLSFATATD